MASLTPPRSNASASERKKVVIVGGGPVGALAALYFVKDGWLVEVYELRGGEYLFLWRSSHIVDRELMGYQTSAARRTAP